VPPSSVGLHDIAPHRVYLVSLQHDLYILSVALFLTSRLVVINHYVALRCPDFPPFNKLNSDKAIYYYKITINKSYNLNISKHLDVTPERVRLSAESPHSYCHCEL